MAILIISGGGFSRNSVHIKEECSTVYDDRNNSVFTVLCEHAFKILW